MKCIKTKAKITVRTWRVNGKSSCMRMQSLPGHYIKKWPGCEASPIPAVVALSLGVHCSPIGLIPKSQPGQWRMIVDLSYPRGASVNDSISSSFCSVVYTSVDDAVQFLRRLGPHALMVKVDLKSTYRIVPIHPQDRFLLGVHWEGEAYIDQALPFGLCSALLLFTAVADAIGWALYQAGFHFLIHYLDDYLSFFIRLASLYMVLLFCLVF